MITNAKDFLGRGVEVVIDRPLGSHDGEELDAYYLGIDKPLKKAKGFCIAVIHRTNNDDDKLVVVPKGIKLSDEEIGRLTHFQEQWFEHIIIRK